MSLVKIKDFKGSLVAKEALENINYLGINSILASYGYSIDVTPVMESTPKGMIEDSPNSHMLEIEREVLINSKHTSLPDDEIFNIYCIGNTIKPKFIIGCFTATTQNIWSNTDENGATTKWYKYKISVNIKRKADESNEDYAMRISEIAFKYANKDLK